MKVLKGTARPEYVRNPDHSRGWPEDKELDIMKVDRANPFDSRRRAGAKLWRKAREGKL